MASFSPEHIEAGIADIYAGNFNVDAHSVLQLFCDEVELLGYPFALNEIAILKHDISSMITIHTNINDEYIAHEVGHHVQNELGILGKAHQKMSQLSQKEANKVSVQIELQADFLAGLWGHDEQALYGSMEKGDLEEALNTALVIGDDYLQKRATGRTDTSQFTHGTSAQRKKWFNKGFTSGDISQGNTFAINYNDL